MRKPKSSSGDPRTRPRQEAQAGRAGSGQRVTAGLPSGNTRHDLIISLVLLALCLCVYWPVHRFDFVVYDDTEYVVENVRWCWFLGTLVPVIGFGLVQVGGRSMADRYM